WRSQSQPRTAWRFGCRMWIAAPHHGEASRPVAIGGRCGRLTVIGSCSLPTTQVDLAFTGFARTVRAKRSSFSKPMREGFRVRCLQTGRVWRSTPATRSGLHRSKVIPSVRDSATPNPEAQFSTDGQWVAYVSAELGSSDVFVRSYPGPGGRWQISNGGGRFPI